MAVGDDALAAGMTLVPGTAPANTLETIINGVLDEIARRTAAVMPLTKGGTGATSAAAARTNLGLSPLAIMGVSEVVRAAPGNGIQLRWSADRVRATVDVTDIGGFLTDKDGVIEAAAIAQAQAAEANGNANGRVSKGGDTITGNLFLPNSSAATSGFTVAYINADGRVSRGSSSERYKKYISEFDANDLGDIWPTFVRYKMRGDGILPADPSWRYGYIAESLLGTDAEPFAVHVEGQVESIDFIGLLLAQTAQLHTASDLAAQRIADLEARISVLEGTQP